MGLLRRPTTSKIVEEGRLGRPCEPGALRAHPKNQLAASPSFPFPLAAVALIGPERLTSCCKHCSSQTSAWSGMARDGGGGRMAQLVSFPLHPRIRRRARRLSKPSESVRFFGMSRDGVVRLICSHPNLCVGVAAPGAAHRALAWSSWSPSRPRETDPLLQVGGTAPGWGGWNDSDLLIHGSRKPLTL
jgi:hypothetical protein